MKLTSGFANILKNSTASVKKNTGVSVGFHDPDTWISTGNYALNYRMSGNFEHGCPLGKVVMFAGESGSGKSFIASGNIVREAQKQGIFVVLIDSENALDEEWLTSLGVDTNPEKLLKLNVGMLNDASKFTYEFIDGYRKEYQDVPREERQKVLFVVDSLGFMSVPNAVEQFKNGDMKGDLGHKAKAMKAYITQCVNSFGDLNIGMICVNHSYASQDMYNPDPVISGGQGMIFASSMVVSMKKLKLKEDDEGNKTSEVNGIRSMCNVVKTRYNKPFESIEIKIPWDTGMDPYSGLFDMFDKYGLLSKTGNRYVYTDIDTGEQIIKFRKAWLQNEDNCLDLIMAQFKRNPLIEPIKEEDKGDENYDGSDYNEIE